jgi:hypothetical protein
MAHFKKAAQSRKVPQPLPKAPSLLPIGGSLPKVHTWLQHEAALNMEGGTIQLRSCSCEKMPQKPGGLMRYNTVATSRSS